MYRLMTTVTWFPIISITYASLHGTHTSDLRPDVFTQRIGLGESVHAEHGSDAASIPTHSKSVQHVSTW